MVGNSHANNYPNVCINVPHFQVPSIKWLPAELLPLYCSGERTGLVVDCAFGESRVMPVLFLEVKHKMILVDDLITKFCLCVPNNYRFSQAMPY